MDNRKLWVLGGAALLVAIGSTSPAQASPVMGKIEVRAAGAEFTPLFPHWKGNAIRRDTGAWPNSSARQTLRRPHRRGLPPFDWSRFRQRRSESTLPMSNSTSDIPLTPNVAIESRAERYRPDASGGFGRRSYQWTGNRPETGSGKPRSWLGRHSRRGHEGSHERSWLGRHSRRGHEGSHERSWRREGPRSHRHGTSFLEEYISGNGKLRFSHFRIHGIDRDDITLESLEDGLLISGPAGVHARGMDFFTVSYKVTALDETMPILGASLELDSNTGPGHPRAMVIAGTKLFGKGNGFFPEKKRLKAYDIGGHGEHPSDYANFRKARDSVYVKDTVFLRAGGSHAEWISSSNHFPVLVPEPGTASLLGLGLTGLVIAGRRRR